MRIPPATKPDWKFYVYEGANDADWSGWYEAQNDTVKAKHDDVLETLEQWAEWGKPHADIFKERGIVEIRITGDVQWRILGCYGPERGERQVFTVVMICNKKQKRYDPPSALDTAERRIKNLKSGKARRVTCERPGKDA